jgi:hypothetical protein
MDHFATIAAQRRALADTPGRTARLAGLDGPGAGALRAWATG